eukprot:1159936-Pelagomonas_calceolata.AAC.7
MAQLVGASAAALPGLVGAAGAGAGTAAAAAAAAQPSCVPIPATSGCCTTPLPPPAAHGHRL